MFLLLKAGYQISEAVPMKVTTNEQGLEEQTLNLHGR